MKPGLYIVSTPIGNLKDITFRAIDTLRNVDMIACEDTRETIKLLNHYGIKKKLISYNDINKKEKTPKIIKMIKNGKRIGLVSDAGTPGICDPGFYLIRETIREGLYVTVIPGPVAFVMALVLSGIPNDRFAFIGFLSRRSGRRKKELKEIKNSWNHTIVFYESIHRIEKTLKDLKEIFEPERKIIIARELTKYFEEVIRTDLENVDKAVENMKKKGEIVVVLEGTPEKS